MAINFILQNIVEVYTFIESVLLNKVVIFSCYLFVFYRSLHLYYSFTFTFSFSLFLSFFFSFFYSFTFTFSFSLFYSFFLFFFLSLLLFPSASFSLSHFSPLLFLPPFQFYPYYTSPPF